MESQDHKLTAPSGHENHAPHLCHKCGWPFPNAHPSARHRRAHRKVCGKVEGYKLSESEADNSIHSAVSDDEHHSDGDQLTPSPKGEKISAKEIGSVGDRSYRSEDETFSDAVTEFSDSGISPGMEERQDSVTNLTTIVKQIDDELSESDATAGSLNDAQPADKVKDPESLERATSQPEAAEPSDIKLDRSTGLQSDNNPIESEIPMEVKATGSLDAKQVQMSSGDPNDLKGVEDINSREGLADAVEVAQSVESGTIYMSKSPEEEGKDSDSLSLSSSLLGADKTISSSAVVESKLLEADKQATDSVPVETTVQHKENESSDSADLKLDLPEAGVQDLDAANVNMEQEKLNMAEHDKQASNAPILESKADSSKETDLSETSKTEERSEDVHVLSLAKDLPVSDNPEVALQDFKDLDKFKASFPLDLGSGVVISPAKDDTVAASETDLLDTSKTEEGGEDVHVVSLAKDLPISDNPELLLQDFKDSDKFKSSFPLDLGSEVITPAKDDSMPDGSISSVALDVSEDGVSEEKVAVRAEGKPDSSVLASTPNPTECGVSSIPTSEPEPHSTDSKDSHPSHSSTDLSEIGTIVSSVKKEKQTPEIDDPVIERAETCNTVEQENKGLCPENEILANKETTPVDTRLSESNQTPVTIGMSDHDEHDKARAEHSIVAESETEKEKTEEKLAGVSGSDVTVTSAGGHTDSAVVAVTTEHESRDDDGKALEPTGATEETLAGVSESDKAVCSAGGHDSGVVADSSENESRDLFFHEASEEGGIRNDAKALEPTGATGLDSQKVSDSDVKEPAGLLVSTDSDSHVVDNSHAGNDLKSATGIISPPSQSEGNDELAKQNDTVSAVDVSVTSSSRTDSLDANWGSVSVLSTQSESTTARDLQKPTGGAGAHHTDKSDDFEPPSFMTLVESGEKADKEANGSEIESQQPKTEALKAGWFPSISNVANESQGRKKNEEIIAKVTNWSTGKQHTPLKNLLGEAKSPNAKQVPAVGKKDETATKTTVNSILSSEAPTEQAAVSKEAEKEWNSPARYPVDIKKEKRKTKPYWVPFVCCSSVHQDA